MILPNNGVITVNGSLDRETKDSYNLRIGVSNFDVWICLPLQCVLVGLLLYTPVCSCF